MTRPVEGRRQMCNAEHAGGGGDEPGYEACITSYDYDAPISEAGDYGQPGIGGPSKFDVRHVHVLLVLARTSAA